MPLLKPTERFNPAIKIFLQENGVEFKESDGFILVDRTSMCQTSPMSGWEQNHYGYWLNAIRQHVPNARITWSMRSDDWLMLDIMAED